MSKPVQLEQMVSLGQIAERSTLLESAVGMEAAITPPDKLNDREGFDHEFLDHLKVDFPKRTKARDGDEAPLMDGSGPVLKYQHFSIIVSKLRRMAMFTACNIDGTQKKKIKRTKDKWLYDGRMLAKYQIGEDLYKGNHLDRGHLVRREDPVWGPNAGIANNDTFHFTNCSPQFDSFNQQLWLSLENHLLLNSAAHGLKISVFTGPVFGGNDMEYRGVLIPRAYWKVVCLVTEGGRPSVTAYKVSQADLLAGGLEFVFGEFKTYQVSVAHVEKLSQLDFGELRNYDGYSTQESVVGADVVTELTSWQQIRI